MCLWVFPLLLFPLVFFYPLISLLLLARRWWIVLWMRRWFSFSSLFLSLPRFKSLSPPPFFISVCFLFPHFFSSSSPLLLFLSSFLHTLTLHLCLSLLILNTFWFALLSISSHFHIQFFSVQSFCSFPVFFGGFFLLSWKPLENSLSPPTIPSFCFLPLLLLLYPFMLFLLLIFLFFC